MVVSKRGKGGCKDQTVGLSNVTGRNKFHFIYRRQETDAIGVLGRPDSTFAASTFLLPSGVKHIKRHPGPGNDYSNPEVRANKCTI